MKPKILLRITVFVTLFYAFGHIMGHLTRKETTDPVNKEVIRQMEQYKFNVNGSMRSWDNFYEALSLDSALVLVVFAIIFWILSGIADKHQSVVYKLLWPILICFIGFTITHFLYVFMIPTVMSLITCILIIATIIQLRRQPGHTLEG
jgi:ABC-type proline/glycine betaine transport system permease subunit